MGLERSTFIRRDSGAILQDFRCEPLNDSSADHLNGRRLYGAPFECGGQGARHFRGNLLTAS